MTYKPDLRAEIHTTSKVNDPKETLCIKENNKYEVQNFRKNRHSTFRHRIGLYGNECLVRAGR